MLYMPWDMEVMEFLAEYYRKSVIEIEKQMESNLLEICNGIVF